jgi:hypothetical protein
MHTVTFFPLGNADCCLIELARGQKLLFDYANLRDPDDSQDLRIDLVATIQNMLGEQDSFDAVAFTHADDDHVHGSSEFFHLEHAKKYQGPGRIKINELWVPAAFIVEEGLENDARILQAEARYRLRNGQGIRVFSRPDRLSEWFAEENIPLADREQLITDAGQLIPGFKKSDQGIEFFVHSPFAERIDDELMDRNDCSLVVQATFQSNYSETRLVLSADTTCYILADMVQVTKIKGEFKVTMEHPTTANPAPLVIAIDDFGATIKKSTRVGSIAVTSVRTPRAG